MCSVSSSVYVYTPCFFPRLHSLDGREVSGEGGRQGKEEEISVGELTVSNL